MNMKLFKSNLLKQNFENETCTYELNESYEDNVKVKGLVTNPTITNKGNIHFHSTTKFKRGDMVKVSDNTYLIDSDVDRLRGEKYKGIGYFCNFEFDIVRTESQKVGVDGSGRPIFQDVVVFRKSEKCVLTFKQFSVQRDFAILPDISYEIMMKDTELARELVTTNTRITIGGKQYSVYNIIYDKQGILTLLLRFVI